MPEKHDEGGSTRDRVILLHGFGGLPVQLSHLAGRLRSAGFATSVIGYPSWRWPIPRIVAHLNGRIGNQDARPLHFVCHSMGGLIARALLARHRPRNLGHVVMLGTPHGGSELADLLFRLGLNGLILNRSGDLLRVARSAATQSLLAMPDYPLGLIAGDRPLVRLPTHRVFPGPHDGKVSVAATYLDGAADHLIMPVAHTAMLYDAAVARQVAHFLDKGRFERPAETQQE